MKNSALKRLQNHLSVSDVSNAKRLIIIGMNQ